MREEMHFATRFVTSILDKKGCTEKKSNMGKEKFILPTVQSSSLVIFG